VRADALAVSAARASVVAAALTMASCGGNADPTPTPTPSPTTAPPTSTPSPDAVIAAAGDISCSRDARAAGVPCHDVETSNLLVTARLLLDQDLEAVLPLGDLQYEFGFLADFQTYYHKSWGRFKEISWPTTGNHEYEVGPAVGYFDYWNGTGVAEGRAGHRDRGYYSFDLGTTWHFISLNSTCDRVGGCGADSPQGRWLKDDLARNRRPCTIAYWHHPRFSSGPSRNMDIYQPFWQMLYDAGADVVLVAHDHLYERFAPMTPTGQLDERRGIRQFTVGTGGRDLYTFGAVQPQSQVRFRDEFGVLFMKLQPQGYGWQFRTIDGKQPDSGNDTCH
jgi:hypothetical protein